ncbi:MAG TPA: hypothetical protein VET90_08815 [Candidatus Binatus sp.]|nr:hypothetical protein [Candidatus Binatus sp.]
MQRPTGVTVLAIVAAIGGVLSLLGSLALLGIGAVFAAVYGLGALASLFGLIILALGVVELAIAYGFWTLKPWAWTWGNTLEAVLVVVSLLELVLGYGSISGLVIRIVVAGIVIYYLNMPDIRKVFAAPDKGWPFIGNVGT